MLDKRGSNSKSYVLSYLCQRACQVRNLKLILRLYRFMVHAFFALKLCHFETSVLD